MNYATVIIAMIGTIAPAVLCLPATSFTRQFQLPTCGAETCLTATNGLFNACEPHDLACLCSLEQKDISDYVTLVEPCINGDAGHDICTDGAIDQYKDLLTTVCADEYFGNKIVQFTAPNHFKVYWSSSAGGKRSGGATIYQKISSPSSRTPLRRHLRGRGNSAAAMTVVLKIRTASTYDPPPVAHAFMASLSISCAESNHELQNVPDGRELFARSEIAGNTQSASNSDRLGTSSSMDVVSTSIAHPSMLTATMTKPDATVVSSTTSVSTTTTDPIDYLKPICAITENCLIDQNHNDPCKLENLKCVCKNSNSIGSSTYFDQDCLWKNCVNTRGRTEWLEAFAAACMDANKPILDIPPRWQVLMPAWYSNTTSTSTSISTSTTPSATTSTSIVNAKPVILSEGVIAGIVVGSLAALAIFLSLSCWAWRNHKKAKRKSRENATLADAINPNGVAARIDEITHGSPQHGSINLSERTKSPLQPASYGQRDVYGNLIPRRSSDQYGYIPPINPTMSESNYNPNPTYNSTPAIIEEHYISDAIPAPLNIRTPLNARNLQSQNATPVARYQSPDAYEAYRPRGLSRNDSRRPQPRASQDSMGTTAVTSSPVQRYSADGFGRAAEYDEFGQKIMYR